MPVIQTDQEIAFPEIQNNVQVHHPQFGLGKVLLRTGSDDNSKAIVKFKEEGEKKLLLRLARLTVDRVEDEPAPVPVPPVPADQ
ncbi:hypothetical protein HZA57_05950 [Candidatus Poribacteria bacterium]|nr:hypothetical protein [Candidatus Poribacteria bacterium]